MERITKTAAPSAATALRDSFGDRKIPGISRKITACVSCRRLKIKCHMNDSKLPCSRCRARGLDCNINKSLQTLLESDASWKEQMEGRMKRLEDSLVKEDVTKTNLPNATASTVLRRYGSGDLNEAGNVGVSHSSSDRTGQVTLNLSCSLGAFPAASITGITFTNNIGESNIRPDLVACNVIPLSTANDFFIFYHDHLDSHMHYLLTTDDTLATIRARSSFLAAAICTVAAFCTGSKDYQRCLEAFKNEVSRKLFAGRYDFDDVRALAVGALWLSDISSALNGLAVRISTQLDLHRCITKIPFTKKACYDRTRLYFQVYLCDHHCSLIYGRPPMTTEFRSLKGPDAFLQSEFSGQKDIDLISQVEFWSINRRIFHLFGSDIEGEIAEQRFVEFGRLNDDIDRWRDTWRDVVTQPRRIFDMYFHSAKLYLFSHVFRGPSREESPARNNPSGSMAQDATNAALKILRCAVEEDEDHNWLQKLPFYFGTMIAFASVFLIRTSLSEDREQSSRADEIVRYLSRLSQILQHSEMDDSSSHPLVNIAKSLEAATKEHKHGAMGDIGDANPDEMLDMAFDFDMFASNPLNLTFPGAGDDWMFCPDEIDTSDF